MVKLVVAAARRFFARKEGATMVEYAALIAFFVVVCVAAMSYLGQTLASLFAFVASALNRN